MDMSLRHCFIVFLSFVAISGDGGGTSGNDQESSAPLVSCLAGWLMTG